MVRFEITDGSYGSQIILAYTQSKNGIEVLGKYYAGNSMGWSQFNPVREITSIGDWKAGILNGYEKMNREGEK